MRFMERKGSGLKLIRERTALAPNYEERFMPRFVDDGRFFKVVLWNMNFDTPQDTPQVEIVLEALGESEMSLVELMGKIGLTDRKNGTVKNLAHFSDSLISPPSGAATPPAESRPDSASSPTRSRPRT